MPPCRIHTTWLLTLRAQHIRGLSCPGHPACPQTAGLTCGRPRDKTRGLSARAALPRTHEPLEDESFFIRKHTQPAPAADVRTQKQAFSGYDAASCPGFRSRRRTSAGKPGRARRCQLRRQRRDFTGDHGCARCEHEGKPGKAALGVSLQLLHESRTIPKHLIRKKNLQESNKQINKQRFMPKYQPFLRSFARLSSGVI